jgi:hypothetical protein
MRSTYKILVKKPEGMRPCATPRCRWEDNIRTNLNKIGWEVVNWTHPAQHRDQWYEPVNTIMNLWFPLRNGKFLD